MKNRFGEEFFFEKIDDDVYKFISEDNSATRYSIDDDGNYILFEPHGGPCVELFKYFIEGKHVAKMFFRDGYMCFKVE